MPEHPNLPKINVNAPRPIKRPRPDHFMSSKEREIVVTLLRDRNVQAVTEIGVQEGHGAEIYLGNVPTITSYIGVDVNPNYVPSKPTQRGEVPKHPGRLVKDDPRFVLLVLPRGSLDLRPANLPICDAFIIDGDHGEVAVNHDTELAYACVRPGGLVIWHDYYVDGEGPLDVKAVLNQRAAKGAPIYHVDGTWLAIEQRGKT